MKKILLFTALFFLASDLPAQCEKCNKEGRYGTVRNYELSSYTENGIRYFSQDSRYQFLLRTPIKEGNPSFDSLARRMKEGIRNTFSKQFSDSCTVISINRYDSAYEVSLGYRGIIAVSLPGKIKYRFLLDFTTLFTASSGDFPVLPDSVLFSKSPAISCCKALAIAARDKTNPLAKPESIDLIHLPFALETFTDNRYPLLWVVQGKPSAPDRKNMSVIHTKFIDYFTGRIIKRTSSKVPAGPPAVL